MQPNDNKSFGDFNRSDRHRRRRRRSFTFDVAASGDYDLAKRRLRSSVHPCIQSSRSALNTEAKSNVRLLLLSGIFAVAVIAALLGPIPMKSRAITRTGDMLHLPLFATVTFVAIMLSDRFVSRSTTTRLLTTLMTVFFSGCIELVQSKIGRTASFTDLLSNSVGAAAAFVFTWTRDQSFRPKWAIRSVMLLCLGYVGTGLALPVWDTFVQNRYPATLASFYSNAEFDRWYFESVDVEIVANSSDDTAQPPNLLAVTFYPGDFPAIQLQQMTRNWTSYEALRFTVSCPEGLDQETLRVQLHISDNVRSIEECASFVKVFQMAPGQVKTITLPIEEVSKGTRGRSLDMARMKFVEFQAVDIRKEATLHFANIHLVERIGNDSLIPRLGVVNSVQ